jgi:hypothetical protein
MVLVFSNAHSASLSRAATGATNRSEVAVASTSTPSLTQDEVERIHGRIRERVAYLQANPKKLIAATTTLTAAPGLDLLPKDKDGILPVQIPTYNKVEQLLPLSNQWVIVATMNLEEVSKEIARLVKADSAWSNIDFLLTQKMWMDSLSTPKPDWWIYNNQVAPQVAKYLGQARINIGEKNLDDPNFYSISSPDDPAYKTPLPATRVARFMVSLGSQKYGGINPHYALYSYLEMPSDLVDGKTYTISLKDGKSVTFIYDELTLVSRALKVNQVGYLPDAKKYAYLGAFLHDHGPMSVPDGTTFSVVDAASGAPVLTGPVVLRAANPRFAAKPGQDPATRPFVSGENIYEMDFSGVTAPGNYFITVSGVGRSWPFTVHQNAMAEAFYTAARGMYHQRCGIAIGAPHTPWPRMKCHSNPVYECQYIPLYFDPLLQSGTWYDFDMVGGTMDKTQSTADATGGWHDAGDWDKRIQHYACVLDLLTLFELKPRNFTDGQLNIPDTGNGVPDVLKEAEYGLLVWKKSMTPEGAVAGRLETFTHPTIDDPNYPYAYSLRTRWSTLLYASAAAYYAHLVKPFNAAKSKEYEDSAKKAYAWGTNPENSLGTITIYPKKDRGRGEPYPLTFTEKDHFNIPFLIAAKLRLTILTGDANYIKDLPDLLQKVQTPYNFTDSKGVARSVTLLPARWPFTNRDGSLWLYTGIFHPTVTAVLGATVASQWRTMYIKLADELVVLNDKEYFRRSRPLNEDLRMAWGFDVMTNEAKVLLYAHYLTKDPKYRQAALYNIDYMLGGNASSMSWTTGIGYVYPIPIHHQVSFNDKILDPVPGIAIYGPTEQDLRSYNAMWLPKDPSGKEIRMLKPTQYDSKGMVTLPRLRNWAGHPDFNVGQNEFTIWETMTSGIFVYGYLLDETWQAPEWVKKRQPRDPRVLFGQWYLP